MPLHQNNHHHHGNYPYQVSGNPSCCSPCCCSCTCNSSSSSPLPAIPSDLIQAMAAAQILQTQSLLRPQQLTKDHHHTQSLLHTLIRRVAALESTLSASQSPPPQSPPRRRGPSPPPPIPSPSLRELAARTIQARFRRFLVRRSQTLRDLKRLASIKSNTAALRSKISGDTGAEPESLSQEAMDLLLQLDSIQSFDPMIRDGKRSISRELSRILDFIDKILVRERHFPLRELEASEEKAAPPMLRARSAKRVSFSGHGGAVEDKEVFSRVLEEEEEGFSYGNGAICHAQNGGFGLAAPLPVQMEPRVGL